MGQRASSDGTDDSMDTPRTGCHYHRQSLLATRALVYGDWSTRHCRTQTGLGRFVTNRGNLASNIFPWRGQFNTIDWIFGATATSNGREHS